MLSKHINTYKPPTNYMVYMITGYDTKRKEPFRYSFYTEVMPRYDLGQYDANGHLFENAEPMTVEDSWEEFRQENLSVFQAFESAYKDYDGNQQELLETELSILEQRDAVMMKRLKMKNSFKVHESYLVNLLLYLTPPFMEKSLETKRKEILDGHTNE